MPIPQLRSIKRYEGSSAVDRTNIRMDVSLESAREGVLAMLALGERRASAGGIAVLFRHNAAFPAERYVLSAGAGGVSVEAGGAAGAVYAASTISQLMLENGGALPHCLAEDEPRFGWRGLLLDVCRHFFPIETVRRLVDVMAFYKYNRLHLHLTDDQGFRFESERYPLLNSVGSFRKSTFVRHDGVCGQDGLPHGGYYTKAELRELVRFAKALGIEIVPEFDMPGHALSALASYPELACFPEPVEVATRLGVTDFSKKLYCAGSEKTYDFLFSLLDESLEVFPFEYMHIGGDEAVKTDWKRCERCQSLRTEQGLKDERELQGFFLNRVIEHLKTRGRRAIVWNDGLCDTLSKDAVCQYWTPFPHEGRDRTARHVNAGGEAILSPFLRLYYDYPYAATPLNKTFRYRAALPGVRKKARGNILGIEAALWTEWIDSEEKLFFNALPRLAATAETGWAARGGRYREFFRRLKPHYELYERLGLDFAANAERPEPIWTRIKGVVEFLTKETHAELLRQKRRRGVRNSHNKAGRQNR
jgi:hexosaminidase